MQVCSVKWLYKNGIWQEQGGTFRGPSSPVSRCDPHGFAPGLRQLVAALFALFHVFLRYNKVSCGPKAAASSASCTGKLINGVEGKRRIHLPPASKGAGSKERKAIK